MIGNERPAGLAANQKAAIFIGAVALDNPVLLAPMSGVTDAAMRRIARRCGAGLVVSEMVASDRLVLGDEEARLRAESPGIGPHVIQIAGREPHWMGEAARKAVVADFDLNVAGAAMFSLYRAMCEGRREAAA